MIKATSFITENFLLHSKNAEVLYHEYAREMPILDYHNHLSAKQIAENQPLNNITEAWLNGDHYKWRAMRANGVEEHFITGNASLEARFDKWAETVPHTLRNPLFHWTHLELKRYFDIEDILQPNSAKTIYEKANEVLAQKTPAQLLEAMKVEVVCTTDDPTDDLQYHQQIAKGDFYTRVFPTFRSDALFRIELHSFKAYLEKLSSCVAFPVDSFTAFLKAVDTRIKYFNDYGCRLSDFGVGGPHTIVPFTLDEVEAIFSKSLKGEAITTLETNKYRSALFLHLGRKYHEYNWVQQYHLGPIRNNNSRLQEQAGADIGCDSIGDYPMADFMSALFNTLNTTDQLTKTITYNLDPSQNEVFATMMGNYNGEVPGKMQWGSAWWFLDQKEGMEKQLNTLSNMGLLSRFIGMLTDSRSFLSFPRHEYFRRILCNLLADDINTGLLPSDLAFIGKMVQDICYYNAREYFEFS